MLQNNERRKNRSESAEHEQYPLIKGAGYNPDWHAAVKHWPRPQTEERGKTIPTRARLRRVDRLPVSRVDGTPVPKNGLSRR